MILRDAWPQDWPQRLMAHVESAGRQGHVWGENDCALFTCNWIAAITGFDPAGAFRGHYTTGQGSLKALKKYGTGELISTFDGLMPPRVSPLRARRGDAVAIETDVGPALGLCLGPRAVFVALDGLAFRATGAVSAVWPVG